MCGVTRTPPLARVASARAVSITCEISGRPVLVAGTVAGALVPIRVRAQHRLTAFLAFAAGMLLGVVGPIVDEFNHALNALEQDVFAEEFRKELTEARAGSEPVGIALSGIEHHQIRNRDVLVSDPSVRRPERAEVSWWDAIRAWLRR